MKGGGHIFLVSEIRTKPQQKPCWASHSMKKSTCKRRRSQSEWLLLCLCMGENTAEVRLKENEQEADVLSARSGSIGQHLPAGHASAPWKCMTLIQEGAKNNIIK